MNFIQKYFFERRIRKEVKRLNELVENNNKNPPVGNYLAMHFKRKNDSVWLNQMSNLIYKAKTSKDIDDILNEEGRFFRHKGW